MRDDLGATYSARWHPVLTDTYSARCLSSLGATYSAGWRPVLADTYSAGCLPGFKAGRLQERA